MFRSLLLGSFSALFYMASAAPAAAYEKLPRSLAGLSAAHFAGSVRVNDDPLSSAIILSTHEGYKRSRAIDGALADDVHLRAAIDRRTGRVTWQVWHDLAYVGGKRELASIRFLSPRGLYETAPLIAEHRLDRCPPTDGVGSCGHAVRIAFEVPERAIREIAGSYEPGTRAPWRFRFTEAHGKDMTGGIAPAEVAGLLQAVDAWRSGRDS